MHGSRSKMNVIVLRSSAWNKAALTGWSFIKFNISKYLDNLGDGRK
jgi:hypothetical protein